MSQHFLQSGLLAMLFFAGVVALLSLVMYPSIRPRLLQLPCQIRAKLLMLWLSAPAAIGILLAFFELLPSGLGSHELMTDHCSSHDNGIAHLCWFDPIVHISEAAWVLGLVLMLLLVVFNLYKASRLLLKHWRFQKTLYAVSEKEPQHGIFRIASENFFVFSSGLLVPNAFISSQLLDKLSPQQLEVVLAHEKAHCRRRDVLRRLLFNIVGLLHFPKTRQRLLDDLELAGEQICDIAAINKVGDRVFVAETILAIARQLNVTAAEETRMASFFHGSHVELRIRQLLEQPAPASRRLLLSSGFLLLVFLGSCVMLTMPLHHSL